MKSGSHSRRSSSGSQKASDAYQPPVAQDDAFCNNFWSIPSRSTTGPDGKPLTYEGKEGFEMLMSRMKAGTKTLEDLRLLFKERAAMEDDYSKRLAKLSKTTAGAGEIGHIERAIDTIKTEIDASSKAHSDLATILKQQDSQVSNFLSSREAARKPSQVAVEKAWRVKREQRDIVNKAKAKYEKDAIDMTGMHAQAALSQGRELDKVTMKMDKISQTVVVNEKEYSKCVEVLRETTVQWNGQWKAYCDLCQDQEEERLAFIKARLWDWANALSTVAMAEDESSERSRVGLEQCDPATDLQIFVRHCGTGSEIPDPPPFIDYKIKEGPPKQTFKSARFARASTRGIKIKHSPSAVEDITKAFKSSSQQTDRARSTSPSKAPQPQQSLPLSTSTNTINNNGGRPAFAPDANMDGGRPGLVESNSSSSMFAPTRQSAAAKSSRGYSEQTPSPSVKDGQIAASAFGRKRGLSANQLSGDASTPPGSSPAPARYEGSSSQPGPPTGNLLDDDPDDPLVRALAQLSTTPSQPSLRPSRSGNNVGRPPSPGAVALPGMAAPQSQPPPSSQSQYGMSPAQREREAYNRRPQSSSSPAPVAASLMQPPSSTDASQPLVQYGQSYAGDRPGSRPPSRHGSSNSRSSNNPPPQQQQQQHSYAGVGARGNSPGPQPYNPQGGMGRVPSPAPGGIRVASPAAAQYHQQPSHQQGWGPPHSQAPPGHNYGGGSISGISGSMAGYAPSVSAPQGGYASSPSQSFSQPPPAQQQQPFQHPPPQAAYVGQPVYSHPQQVSQHSRYPSGPYPASQTPTQSQPPPQQSFGYQQQQPVQSPVNGHAQYGSQPYEQQAQTPLGQPAQHAPTGQFDDNGLPILFYVNAIYDYEASGPEEFSFSKGDVIAVTKTEADGWWQGRHVGVSAGGNIFPSNFTELLP